MSRSQNYPRAAFLRLTCFALLSLLAQAQMPSRYSQWLNEDVHWIITSQEQTQFLDLSTDDDRDQFIVDFWEQRNPVPGSKENRFKEEHYRRFAYANMHFADDKHAGWESDRGRIYILYGPPDSIDSRAGADYQLASGIKSSTSPFQIWYYKSINGIGRDVTVRFVDKCRCGDLRQDGEIEKGNAPRNPQE